MISPSWLSLSHLIAFFLCFSRLLLLWFPLKFFSSFLVGVSCHVLLPMYNTCSYLDNCSCSFFFFVVFYLVVCRTYRNKDCCADQKSCTEILYKGQALPSYSMLVWGSLYLFLFLGRITLEAYLPWISFHHLLTHGSSINFHFKFRKFSCVLLLPWGSWTAFASKTAVDIKS